MIPAPTPYAQALADNAISRQSAHRYEQLADVPQDAFDEALRAPDVKPSTTRIIAQIGVTLDPSSKWQ